MSISNSMPRCRGDWMDEIDRKIMPFVEYPGYDYRYPADDICLLTEAQAEEIRQASKILFRVFAKAVAVCQECGGDFLRDLEIPEPLLPYLRQENPMHQPSWLSRFDYVLDRAGRLKMVEINADTPCAVIEAYYANDIACRHFGRLNPNEGKYEELADWLGQIYWASSPEVNLATGKFAQDRPFVFSCFEDYVEDYGTTLFLLKAMKKGAGSMAGDCSICFESFYQLGVDEEGGLVLPDGRRAKGIYRLHPMEILIDEETPEGEPLGQMFMEGYTKGNFTMFNPPEAIIMQSKGFQALLWALAQEKRELFTAEELAAVERYMLPSFFERPQEQGQWIRKPLWGREGLDITVVDGEGNLLLAKEVAPEDVVRRESEKCMYQRFVDQPETEVKTDEGLLTGYRTLSCFMHGEKPGALYARFSPDQIAGTEAYWLPLGL